jgi:peptidyl-prolyl cis-trans isomerase D
MATLQSIRNRAGILIALIIGLAIFSFVIQDFLGSGQKLRARSKNIIAEIDGQSIDYQEYLQRVDKLSEYYRIRMGETSIDENTMETIREQTWQDIVKEYSTKKEYRELGVAVSTDEFMDMVQGRNPHPIIQSIFTDPQTGMLNRSFLVQFLRTMNEDPSGQQKTIWLYLENEIMKDRIFSKYNNLVSKGLNVTGLEAETTLHESARKVDFSYIVKRYNALNDSLVNLKNSDFQEYYQNHQNEFEQEASLDLEYVVFDVIPTQEDDQAIFESLINLGSDFRNAEDAIALVNLESDIPFDDKNYKNGEISDTINDFMFKARIGDVYGPYMEDESYRMARLVEINYLPDSVRARHILIQPSQSMSKDAASKLADSLKTALDNGSNFTVLAMQFSADASNTKGGDLGWFTEGTMVKPFNDACFKGKIGEIQLVETRFGYHIIEVLERGPEVKKVKVAFLSKKIIPSSGTYQTIYAQAIGFSGKNNTFEKFNAAITEQGLTKRYADQVQEFQRTITGLESPRELIRWGFNSNIHDVSQVFEFGNKFVVAMVAEKRKAGIAPLDQVKPEIELELKKNKKADIMMEEMRAANISGASFEDIAKTLNLPVLEAQQVSFTSVSIPAAGIEPDVIAAASILKENDISEPLKGNNGVYLIRINKITDSEIGSTAAEKSRLSMMRQSQANYEAYDALQKASNIKDNRARFF